MVTAKKKAAAKKPAGPYCYALVDGETPFYIGKGRGGRMFQHERAARRGLPGPKCDRIRAILAEGREVRHVVLGEYETDAQAYAAEREFIASSEALTNANSGGGGSAPGSPAEAVCRNAQRLLSRMVPFHEWRPSGVVARKLTAAFGGREQAYRAIVQSLLRSIANPEMEAACEAVSGWR